ncbi:hypothetical protein WAI453_003875 [Rhynchosporium graminicola]
MSSGFLEGGYCVAELSRQGIDGLLTHVLFHGPLSLSLPKNSLPPAPAFQCCVFREIAILWPDMIIRAGPIKYKSDIGHLGTSIYLPGRAEGNDFCSSTVSTVHIYTISRWLVDLTRHRTGS